jgi:reticulon-4-interacting protein 1, mitochondrial
MRAWTITRAGLPSQVLKLSSNTPTPKLRKDSSDILIKVSHVALHPGTTILMNLVPMFFRGRTNIAETDFSGEVRATAEKTTTTTTTTATTEIRFPPGTPVFGSIPIPLHIKGTGCLAEYVVLPSTHITRKPPSVGFAEASGLAVSGTTALTLLDAAKLQPGQKILINAPCGGVGNFFTQMARDAVGETGRIVGICSRAKWECARKLGCDEVLDYQDGNADLISKLTDTFDVNKDTGFDMIIDCVGSQPLWLSCAKYLKPGKDHAYVTVGVKFSSFRFRAILGAVLSMMSNALWPVWLGGVDRTYKSIMAIVDTKSLERLGRLAEEGKIRTVVGEEWRMECALKVSTLICRERIC